MRTEIGSEFWDIPLTKEANVIFKNATWFISGRAAFRSILQQIKFENCGLRPLKIAIPSYLCESIIAPLIKEDVEYKLYPVWFKDGLFQCDYSNLEDCKAVLIIDYFGYDTLSNNCPKDGKIIIRDLTHSVFTKKYDDADYYFGSLRKWAGFLCGGFAWKREGNLIKPNRVLSEFIVLRKEAMELKEDYIVGKTDNKDYLDKYHKAECLLEECEIALCGSTDIKNAAYLDIEYIKNARRNNALVLITELSDICLFKQLNKNDCPLFVPIAVARRDKLRQYLISHDIYCPIHWPKPYSEPSESDFLYSNELSLVCDQRYSVDDMKRIVSFIREFMENNKDAECNNA